MRQKKSIETFNYWNDLRGRDDAPLRTHIDPASLLHLLSELFILEAMPSGSLVVRLAGTRICDFFGREIRTRDFASLWGGTHAREPVEIAGGVIAYAAPALLNATGFTASGRHVSFEMLLLPLRSPNGVCERLLGCLVPAANPAWLGGEPLEFLTMDRSRLLTDRSPAVAEAPSRPEVIRTALASKVDGIGNAVRRILQLADMDGGRAH